MGSIAIKEGEWPQQDFRNAFARGECTGQDLGNAFDRGEWPHQDLGTHLPPPTHTSCFASRVRCHLFTASVGSQAKQKPLLEYELVKAAPIPLVFFYNMFFCRPKVSHNTPKMGKLRNKLFINLIKRYVYF